MFPQHLQQHLQITKPSLHPRHLLAQSNQLLRDISPYSKSHESKVAKKLFKTDQWATSGVSDDDLLKEMEKLDK